MVRIVWFHIESFTGKKRRAHDGQDGLLARMTHADELNCILWITRKVL